MDTFEVIKILRNVYFKRYTHRSFHDAKFGINKSDYKIMECSTIAAFLKSIESIVNQFRGKHH